MVKRISEQPSCWYSAKSGIFLDKPGICLEESFWDGQSSATTKRYFIIDASGGDMAVYATTYQGYTEQEYCSLLRECGFEAIEFYPSLGEAKDKYQDGLIAVVARKSSKNI